MITNSFTSIKIIKPIKKELNFTCQNSAFLVVSNFMDDSFLI